MHAAVHARQAVYVHAHACSLASVHARGVCAVRSQAFVVGASVRAHACSHARSGPRLARAGTPQSGARPICAHRVATRLVGSASVGIFRLTLDRVAAMTTFRQLRHVQSACGSWQVRGTRQPGAHVMVREVDTISSASSRRRIRSCLPRQDRVAPTPLPPSLAGSASSRCSAQCGMTDRCGGFLRDVKCGKLIGHVARAPHSSRSSSLQARSAEKSVYEMGISSASICSTWCHQ